MSKGNPPRPVSSRVRVSASRTPPTPGSRLGLSRARILDAALALLDRDGLAGFTIRRLAGELGVGTMTIYGYFRSKDELLDALVDTGVEKMTVGRLRGSWRARLRGLMVASHHALIEHPGVVELRFKRPLISPGALTLTETAMQILRDAGFGKRDAARAYRVLFVYTFGFAAFGPEKRGGAESDATFEALSALDTDAYPALVDAAREASNAMSDRGVFELGLDYLLDSLEQQLRTG